MSELAIVQTIRFKRRATIAVVADIVGLGPADVHEIVDRLAGAGCLTLSAGTVKLTDAGRAWLETELLAERAQVDADTLAAHYEEFAAPNDRLKQIIASWQLTDESTPNDHGDEAYDAKVIKRLYLSHDDAEPLLREIGLIVPRLTRYAGRLDRACESVRTGQLSYIASPIVDSYHQVWFELHEELINLLGRSRYEEEAAAEDPNQ